MKNSKEDPKHILASCGIYCSECSFKVAYETQNRAHISAMPTKFDKFKEMEMDQFHCEGCTPENTFADCKIKQCAMARKLEHCGQCGEYPCALINNFAADGIPHHKKAKESLEYVKKYGMEKFIEEKEKRSRCDCGEKLSWYVTKCLVCGRTEE
jgi:hypothetical protein